MEYLSTHVDLIKAASWFFIGVFCHRTVAKVLGYGQLALFAEEFNDSLLRLIKSMVDDFAFAKETKYRAMRSSGITEDKINQVKSFDKQAYSSWKRDLIDRFLSSYPKAFYSTIKFSDWEGAMKRLEELDKKNS